MKSLPHAVWIGMAVSVLLGAASWMQNARAQSAPVVLGTRDPDRMAMRDVGASPRPDPQSKLQVKGLTGTLNKVEVHQTMEQRQRDFDRCIAEGQRALSYVSGAMSFGFKVDGDGRIAEARTLSSTVGHRPLEQCLSAAVANTQFPKPAGRATAVFSWGLRVDPATSRKFETGNPKQLRSLARKQARSVFSTCEIKRRRARFKITAYVAAGGRLLSAGAVPQPQAADEKVDCVLEQLGKWHLPKLKRASKFTFDLR